MVSNPMQKKARNSFLLGMVITLIICVTIAALFYFLVMKKEEVKQKEEGKLTYVYRLNTNVQSGQEITPNMVESILVTEKAVPAGAFASKINKADAKGKQKLVDQGFPTGYKSKLNLNAGTVLSDSLVYVGEEITSDLRYVEFNMLVLPTTVRVGSYIDVRLALPNGQDLIVVSKKEIKSLLGNTVGLLLTEAEILMMESAIVDAYIMTSSKLYAIQYVQPGIQEAAIKTYEPTDAVKKLIDANRNIKDDAKKALRDRYLGVRDAYISPEINNYELERQENLEAGMEKEIEAARAAREAYLSGLTSY